MKKKFGIVISCEHAVNTIPRLYLPLFAPYQHLLSTHRGIDFGALAIAQHLATASSSALISATASRLLIDCNRSLNRPHCFSEVTNTLPALEKQAIIDQYYQPFRQAVIAQINQHIGQGLQVLHLSIHSFTPVLNDVVRHTDLAFLYDPRRTQEKHLARHWQSLIKEQAPEYRVRMNYPYQGISDGFTSFLRKQYSQDQYLGLEIETNQALTQSAQSLNNINNILTLCLFNNIC